MFDRILCPIDGSEGTEVALEHALDVAADHGATIHVLYVADTTLDSVTQIHGEVIDTLEQEGEDVVRAATDRAEGRGIPVVSEVLQGEPYSTIVDYADSQAVDLIVLPTQGRRGLERIVLGSTTERVVRHATVPVLTIQPTDEGAIRYPYEDVLIPTDGSDCARKALSIGVDVARDGDARLHLLSVITTRSLGVDVRSDLIKQELEASTERILAEAAEYAEDAGLEPASSTVEYGQAIHKTIRSYIDEHEIGLVVVGTHGRTGLERYMLGSVTDYLIRTSPVPVLTVREFEQAP